jgi:hypothetical protein
MLEIAELIKSVGFPIFVAVYVLIRVESTLKELSVSLTALGTAIHRLPCCMEGEKK